MHYELRIGGTAVDPVKAWGKNLCDAAVRKALIDDAQKILGGKAGGGGGAAPPANPTQPTTPTTPPTTPTPPTPPPNVEPYIPAVEYDPAPYQDPIDPRPFPPTTDQYIPGTTTDNEPTSCSTDVWRAMVNSSVLQTRREMAVNERYIAKGDSIHVYSCFEDFYLKAGETLPVLSETDRWKNAQIDILGKTVTVDVYMGEYSLDGAIINAVDEAVFNFIGMNFNHEWLGEVDKPINPIGTILNKPYEKQEPDGTILSLTVYDWILEQIGDDPNHPLNQLLSLFGVEVEEEHNEEEDDAHDHDVTQYGYLCGKMAEVWNKAKCMNLVDEPPFYSFEQLTVMDPRQFPKGYECLDTGINQNMITLSKNSNVRFDNIVTYLDFVYPKDKACADPLQTGLTVTRRVGSERMTKEKSYLDAVCITPGCTYQNPESEGLGTCETAVKPTVDSSNQ